MAAIKFRINLSLSEDSNSSIGSRSNSHDSRVDSARDTIMKFHKELWNDEILVNQLLFDVSLGRGVDHVSHSKSFDGFVLE